MWGYYKTRDGTLVHAMGDKFVCDNGETYKFVYDKLVGPEGVISRFCESIEKALDIIVERHGGIKYE